jgi:hypothetical protein
VLCDKDGHGAPNLVNRLSIARQSERRLNGCFKAHPGRSSWLAVTATWNLQIA